MSCHKKVKKKETQIDTTIIWNTNDILHTSTEHETEILPTTALGGDGSNNSSSSISESDSCSTTKQKLFMKVTESERKKKLSYAINRPQLSYAIT